VKAPPPPHNSQPSESIHTFANIKQPKIYCKANKTNKSQTQLRNGDFSDSFQTDPSTVALFWHFLHFSSAAIHQPSLVLALSSPFMSSNPSTIACFGTFFTFHEQQSINHRLFWPFLHFSSAENPVKSSSKKLPHSHRT